MQLILPREGGEGDPSSILAGRKSVATRARGPPVRPVHRAETSGTAFTREAPVRLRPVLGDIQRSGRERSSSDIAVGRPRPVNSCGGVWRTRVRRAEGNAVPNRRGGGWASDAWHAARGWAIGDAASDSRPPVVSVSLGCLGAFLRSSAVCVRVCVRSSPPSSGRRGDAAVAGRHDSTSDWIPLAPATARRAARWLPSRCPEAALPRTERCPARDCRRSVHSRDSEAIRIARFNFHKLASPTATRFVRRARLPADVRSRHKMRQRGCTSSRRVITL